MTAPTPGRSAGRELTPFRRGLAHLEGRRFLRARRELAAAVRAGDDDSVWACQSLIHSFLARGDGQQAEPFLRRLLGDDSTLMLYALGYLRRRQGRRAEARACLERAAGRRPRLWAVSNELGWMLAEGGETAAGLRRLGAAERHFRRRGDLWGLATSLTHQATVALVGFHLREALRLFARARTAKQRCGDRIGLATVMHNAGLTYWYLARYHEAISCFDQARSVQRALRNRLGEATTWNSIGLCQLDLADAGRAAASFRAALRTARGIDPAVEATLRANLGVAWAFRGEARETIRHHRAALARLRPSTHGNQLAQVVAELARAQSLAGRPSDALVTLGGLPAELEPAADTRALLLLAREEARARLALGSPVEAFRAVERALRLGARLPEPQRALAVELAEARVIHARALIATGRRRAGERGLRQAARQIDRLLAAQRGASIRMGLLQLYRQVHDALITSLADGGAPPRTIWTLAAELKARELRRTLVSRTETGEGRPPPPRARDELESEIRQLATAPRLDGAAARRLRELRRRYLESEDRTADDAPGLGSGRHRLAAVLAGLPPATALVEYHVMRDTTFVFVASRGSVLRLDLGIGERALDRALVRLLRPIGEAGRAGDPRATLETFDLRHAASLYRVLLAPAAARLPADTEALVIVPDGPLHALPFELLVEREAAGDRWDPGRFERAGYVADRYRVSYARSTLLLRSGRGARPRAPAGLLAVAYSPPEGTVLQSAAGPRWLGPLPAAGPEIDDVARQFGRRQVLRGRRATTAAFRAAAAAQHDVIHLAVHALADPGVPGLSGVVLAPDRDRGPAGFLTGDQVAQIDLRAELVTLSACEAASGRLRGPEGILGLARSFCAAGATSVVASLWPVDDATTRELMREFYRRLRAGRSRPEALGEARDRIRRGGVGARVARAHPFFWASFLLTDHALLTA